MQRPDNIQRVAALLACLTVVACTAAPAPPPVTSLRERDCSARLVLATAHSVPFGSDQATTTILDGQGLCLNAGITKSSYAVFRLPNAVPPYLVMVTSEPRGRALLSPRLMILNAQGELSREISRDAFMFQDDSLYVGFRTHPGERFVIVASDPGTVGRQVSQIMGFADSVDYFPLGHESTRSFIYSHNGRVIVSAQPMPRAD